MPYKWRRICWIWVSHTKVLALNIGKEAFGCNTKKKNKNLVKKRHCYTIQIQHFLCSVAEFIIRSERGAFTEKKAWIKTQKLWYIFVFFCTYYSVCNCVSVCSKVKTKIKFSFIAFVNVSQVLNWRQQESPTVSKNFLPLLVSIPFSYTSNSR